ncbi:hypothetical protein [Streptomyces caniscabiei]|uniref:hypothetical protein n=1 Tax=Streptomyces caniscabiei TaxID=2746961 RepID=UPI001872E3AC|nr:hypothetical protein [Streptomyces caniscabiei]
MIYRMVRLRPPAGRAACSAGEGEVVQAYDAEHGLAHTVAIQAAFAEERPGLQPGEGVLYTAFDL